MKQAFLTLLISLIASVCFAQTEHMKFKGIPINGTRASFVQKLKSKGYNYIGEKDNVSFLEGEFATRKNCTIVVACFENKDQVNLVAVIFPAQNSWSDVSQSYFSLKDMLTEKYGEPESFDELDKFESESIKYDSDYMKFHSVLEGDCRFASEYVAENGKIQIEMKKMDYNTVSVVLRYMDKENTDAVRKKVMEDL